MVEYVTVAADDRAESRDGVIKLHGPAGFEGMRKAGRLAADILDALVPHVVPGVTTGELDDIAWMPLVEARALDLPAITRFVLGEVAERLVQPRRPLPFVRMVRGAHHVEHQD